jgi:hypothetical protein
VINYIFQPAIKVLTGMWFKYVQKLAFVCCYEDQCLKAAVRKQKKEVCASFLLMPGLQKAKREREKGNKDRNTKQKKPTCRAFGREGGNWDIGCTNSLLLGRIDLTCPHGFSPKACWLSI